MTKVKYQVLQLTHTYIIKNFRDHDIKKADPNSRLFN